MSAKCRFCKHAPKCDTALAALVAKAELDPELYALEMLAYLESLEAQLSALQEPAPVVQPDASASELWAEIYRLRAEMQGPDGYATWKDAALAERLARTTFIERAFRAHPNLDLDIEATERARGVES